MVQESLWNSEVLSEDAAPNSEIFKWILIQKGRKESFKDPLLVKDQMTSRGR